MKTTFLLLPIVSLLFLSGCAYPRPTSTYLETPYNTEGTAGSGLIDEGCFRRALT